MKRFILILLICAMLVGCLVSCNIVDTQPNAQPEDPEESPNPEKPVEEVPPFEVYQNPQVDIADEELQDKIYSYLTDYLDSYGAEVLIFPSTLEYNINAIKTGRRPILVKISSDDYYYVCAYFNASHDYVEGEDDIYCCCDSYTWVSFENATDIAEEYNGEKFIAAFQLNRSSLTCDILSKDATVPIIQHFKMFEPKFSKGFNIKAFDEFNHEVIYLAPSKADIVLYCVSDVGYQTAFIDFMYYENEYFIKTFIKMELDKGGYLNNDLNEELGKYYDYLMDPVRYNIYEHKGLSGKTVCYLLTDLNSFVSIFKEQD